MFSRHSLTVIAFLALAMASLAHATVTVVQTGGAGSLSYSISQLQTGAFDVAIFATGSNPSAPLGTINVSVYGNANDVIRNIAVFSYDDGQIQGLSRVILRVEQAPGASLGLSRVESVTQQGGDGELVIRAVVVNGNIGVSGTSPGGNIKANFIEDVVAHNTSGGSPGHITATVETVVSLIDYPNIVLVRSDSGNIYGDVRAFDGNNLVGQIFQVLAPNGSIGTNTSHPNITSAFRIHEVSARSISATISAVDTVTHLAALQHVVTTAGDMTGSINADYLSPFDPGLSSGLVFAGKLDNDVHIKNIASVPLTFDSLEAGRELLIGAFLLSDITINDADGLKGLVVVNSNYNQGAWVGAVSVGLQALSPIPFYSQTGLGGGAIGEMPFNVYDNECIPPNGSVQQSLSSIVISHYGRVTAEGSTPLKIERRQRSTGGAYLNVTSCFDVTTSNDRFLMITPKSGGSWAFQADSDYLITHTAPAQNPPPPGSSFLWCLGVTLPVGPGLFPYAQSYTYTASISP